MLGEAESAARFAPAVGCGPTARDLLPGIVLAALPGRRSDTQIPLHPLESSHLRRLAGDARLRVCCVAVSVAVCFKPQVFTLVLALGPRSDNLPPGIQNDFNMISK